MKRLHEWLKAKLNIRFVVRRAFDKKFKKTKIYRAVGFFQQDKIVTWYEIFCIKFFEKTIYTFLPPEHIYCRCNIYRHFKMAYNREYTK